MRDRCFVHPHGYVDGTTGLGSGVDGGGVGISLGRRSAGWRAAVETRQKTGQEFKAERKDVLCRIDREGLGQVRMFGLGGNLEMEQRSNGGEF